MRENRYQKEVIERLKRQFPGCMVLKNDTALRQGIPDLLILFEDKWAMLEVKASLESPFQPNQEYYLRLLNDMSFADFICPENENEVMYELQQAFEFRRAARLS